MKDADGNIIEIRGFTSDAFSVIFYKENKEDIFEHILIKSSLNKIDLISELNLSPSIINKKLKDEILESARKGGKFSKVYSFDQNKYMKQWNAYLRIKEGAYTSTKYLTTKYSKWVS